MRKALILAVSLLLATPAWAENLVELREVEFRQLLVKLDTLTKQRIAHLGQLREYKKVVSTQDALIVALQDESAAKSQQITTLERLNALEAQRADEVEQKSWQQRMADGLTGAGIGAAVVGALVVWWLF